MEVKENTAVRAENVMGTESPRRLLVRMSLPMMLSMLVLALYNIVDSVFVSHISSANNFALTAVTLCFPFQMLIVGVGVGTGVGTNSLIARNLGAHNYEYANTAGATGIVLGLISGLVFSALYFFLSTPVMGLFTDNPEILTQAVTYMKICGSLCVFSMVGVVLEKTLQATGNMVHPMLTQLAGAVVNCILDPLFIFGYHGFPKMGIAGAAVATVLGQVVAMLLCVYFLFFCKKNNILKISFRKLKMKLATIKEIYDVGIASILMQSINSFTTLLLNSILMSFTPTAVDVLGVYFKIQSFIFMPVFGLNSGAMPILGYNFGAKKKARFMATLKFGTVLALTIMLIGLLIFQIFPTQLLSIFNATPEMMSIGTIAFRTVSICFPFAALSIMFITAFNAVGKGMYSLIVSAIRQIVVILPAAFIFAKVWGVNAVWFAYPLAELIGLVVSSLCLARIYALYLKNM